jgi:hypothetical protein
MKRDIYKGDGCTTGNMVMLILHVCISLGDGSPKASRCCASSHLPLAA